VAGEIAIALGISSPAQAGAGAGAGQFGGTPAGFDPIGQGQATQMPGFGAGSGQEYPPVPGFGQVPGQPGYQQTPGQGGGFGGGAGDALTQPGAWPGSGAGGAGQAGGWQGSGAGGAGQAGGWQGSGAGGAGQAGGWQGSGGGGQQAGWQGGGPIQPGGWQGGYGTGGGLPGGPKRSKTGLFISGAVAVVVIVIIAVIALGGSPKPSKPTPPPSPTPSFTTPPTTPAPTVEPLRQVLNPPGLSPIGTHCVLAGLAKLSAATVTHRLKCNTTVSRLYVWAYQFDSTPDYQQGFTHLQGYLAFKPAGAGSNCPPTGSSSTGETNWRSSNPKYHSYTGQFLDCLTIHGTYGTEVTYLWTLPSQHIVFLAQSWNTNISFHTLDTWWAHLSYG
jgi:hypothetical protein